MKPGIGIVGLRDTLKYQADLQKDFIVPSQSMHFEMREQTYTETGSDAVDRLLAGIATDEDGHPALGEGAEEPAFITPHLVVPEQGVFDPNRIFHGQMAEKLRIPAAYYKRMQELKPDMLCRDVNAWLQDEESKRMVRTIGNTARAFLSNRFRRLDNLPLLMSVIGTLGEMGVQAEDIVSCNVTDTKMYLKVLTPRLEGEVALDDMVQAGLVISNSEVGKGSVLVQPLIYRLKCLNGMIMMDQSIRKQHTGRRITNGEDDGESWQIYTDETMKLDDEAFFAKVNDQVRHALTQEVFDLELDKIRAANGMEVTGDKIAAVKVLSKGLKLSEAEESTVLDNFIEGKEYTQWGMINALTLTSQEIDEYDRATEFERMGGRVLEMSGPSWKSIAEAEADAA